MGFNSAFKGLTTSAISSYIKFSSYRTENILAAIKVSRVTIFREIIIIWYNNQRKRINEWAKCYVFFLFKQVVHIFTRGLNMDNIRRTEDM